MGEAVTRYHISLDVADRAGVLATVAGVFARHEVSIATVRRSPGRGRRGALASGDRHAHRAGRRAGRHRRGTARARHRPLDRQRAPGRGRRLIRDRSGRVGAGSGSGRDRVWRVSRQVGNHGCAGGATGTLGHAGHTFTRCPPGRRQRIDEESDMWRGLIEAYRDRLPVTDATPVVTLHEGNTPLRARARAVRAHRLRRLPQGGGRQPDRLVQGPGHDRRGLQGGRGRRQGDHLRLHRQHQRVGRRVRRPGRAHLRGAGAAGQDRAGQAGPGAGARREAAAGRAGTSTTAWRSPRKLSQDYPVALVNSVNIDRLHGQKTAAFEIVEALGDAPDIHCLPVGNAGNITAYWMGYQEDVRGRQRHPAPEDVRLPGRRRRPDRQRHGRARSRRPSPPRSGSATRRAGPRRWTRGTHVRRPDRTR